MPLSVLRCRKQVWLDHHWDDPALISVRDRLCRNGTATEECAVPMAGFPHGSTTLWCQNRYDSDECEDIKEEVRGQKLTLRQQQRIGCGACKAAA